MNTKEKLKALLDGTAQVPVGSGAILVQQFRTILQERKVDQAKWDELMTRYVNFELKDVEQNANRDAQAAAIRGNLTKELTQPTMTWSVYLKGLRLLGFTSIEFGTRGSGEDFTFEGTTNIVTLSPTLPQTTVASE